jgi:hypothetical protein
MRRRRFISAVGAVSAAALAGCTDDGSDGDDDPSGDGTDRPTDTATPADDTTRSTDAASDDGDGDSESGTADSLGPAEAASTFLTAEDAETIVDTAHPAYPYDLDDEQMDITPYDADEASTTVVAEDVGVDAVLDMYRASEAFSASDLAAALEGERVALVDATATVDGSERDIRVAVATDDTAWRVLWLAPAGAEEPDQPVDGKRVRVVEDVTFDTEADLARVHFVDRPNADQVSAEWTVADSEVSTSTPGEVNVLEVPMAAEDDQLTVTATLDGETELVRREQYPPEDRTVDDVRYELEEPAQAVAELNEVGDVDSLTIRATRSDYETTVTEGASQLFEIATVINPDGDEIVVEKTVDDETTELHRERYHP